MVRLALVLGVLLAGFLALMAFGGDHRPQRRDEDQAHDYSAGSAMRLLGALTGPFAPRVAPTPATMQFSSPGTAKVAIPPQAHDRQVLKLVVAKGGAAVATLQCGVGDLCNKPLCLTLGPVLPARCDGSKAQPDGSLVVPREGGTLTVEALSGPTTVEAR